MYLKTTDVSKLSHRAFGSFSVWSAVIHLSSKFPEITSTFRRAGRMSWGHGALRLPGCLVTPHTHSLP